MNRRTFLALLGEAWAARAVQASNTLWDVPALSRIPAIHRVKTREEGVNAVFYESVPYRGRGTRVFAYYGFPRGCEDRRCPGVVLVHGGDGTAFAEWVRLWNSRGFAAIAMDTCGSQPDLAPRDNPYSPAIRRHAHAGPPGWGGFDQIDEPLRDQWTYHAVAAVIAAHSVLKSLSSGDSTRIGITGISWGGYLTSIVAGLDPRFRFAAPVYGCGFLNEDSDWMEEFRTIGEERTRKWVEHWDPSRYLSAVVMPTLWVDGTNDYAYPLSSLQNSYRLTQGPRTLSTRVRMPHNHPDGATPPEIPAFAAGVLGIAEPLASVTRIQPATHGSVRLDFQSRTPIVTAELNFTTDVGSWKDRLWNTLPASLSSSQSFATAELPKATKAYFINLTDQRGLIVSSEHQVVG